MALPSTLGQQRPLSLTLLLSLSVILYLFSPDLYLFRLCLLFCLFKQAPCQATQQGCLHVSGVLSFLFLSQWGDLTPSCCHLCPLLMSSHVSLLTAEWTKTLDTAVLTSEQLFWVMPFSCCLSKPTNSIFQSLLGFLCKSHCLCIWVVVVLVDMCVWACPVGLREYNLDSNLLLNNCMQHWQLRQR